MTTCGVYQIALFDGRCYVGHSTDIKTRWRRHRWMLIESRHHAKYLQHAWDFYGPDAFLFSIVEECVAEELVAREQFWMDTLDSVFNSRPAADSQMGYRHTPETKAKIGAAIAGANNGFYGHRHPPDILEKLKGPKSEAHRAKMREAWKTRSPMTEETRAKMIAAHTGKFPTDETRAKLSAAQMGNKKALGRIVSEETRRRLSVALKGHKVSTETRRKLSAAKHGKPSYERTPEHRILMSASRRKPEIASR